MKLYNIKVSTFYLTNLLTQSILFISFCFDFAEIKTSTNNIYSRHATCFRSNNIQAQFQILDQIITITFSPSITILNVSHSRYSSPSLDKRLFSLPVSPSVLNGLDLTVDRTRIGVFRARIVLPLTSLYLWACVWFRPLWHYDEILSYTSCRVGGSTRIHTGLRSFDVSHFVVTEGPSILGWKIGKFL